MIQSDALSRRPDLNPEGNDNEDITMLPKDLFVNLVDSELRKEVLDVTEKDEVVKRALDAINKKGPFPMRSSLNDWRIDDGIVLYKDRCYVPPDQKLRRRIVQQYHDSPSTGHPGQFKTLELMRRDYWWPGDSTFVKNYIKGCTPCQQMKVNTHLTTPPLMPIKGPGSRQPFAQISCDFITDLPESETYDSLMVVVDHGLTKGVVIIPCNKSITAMETAELLVKHVYKRFGLPEKFISDRGPQFTAAVTHKWGRLLGIQLAFSTAYHPQTDGESKRTNQEIEGYLRIFCANDPTDWARHLYLVEFSHNIHKHSARNAFPFYLMMGYDPCLFPLPTERSDIPDVTERIQDMEEARKEAEAVHELARQKMMERITRGFKPFKVGDKVLLESKNLRLPHKKKKLSSK